MGWLSLTALLFTSLVLRPPLASVGPLLPELAGDLHIGLAQQGLLTSIPVLSFGFGAFAGPWLAKRLGIDRLMLILQALLIASILLRPWFGFEVLVATTALTGLSIAVANVILPSVVRGRFKNHVPQVTSAYTLVLALSASFAAATAVPTSALVSGWKNALVIWTIPAVVALVIWAWQAKALNQDAVGVSPSNASHSKVVRRSPITWALCAFFGIQSLGFYAVLAWLPSLAIERGFTPDAAGALLGLLTIVGIPSGFVLSANLGRFKRLDWLGFFISLVTLSGFITLLFEGYEFLAAVLMGLGMASTFPLSLTLISTRAQNSRLTTQLSALVQGYGYLLSAAGTYAFAALREITGAWVWPVLMLIVLTAVQAVSSFVAGGRSLIEDPSIDDSDDAQSVDNEIDLLDGS
jgi:CP family cyanate transporter-like MFS transporter